jgi:hypothetical protein
VERGANRSPERDRARGPRGAARSFEAELGERRVAVLESELEPIAGLLHSREPLERRAESLALRKERLEERRRELGIYVSQLRGRLEARAAAWPSG